LDYPSKITPQPRFNSFALALKIMHLGCNFTCNDPDRSDIKGLAGRSIDTAYEVIDQAKNNP
jgi:hypothetical protein